MKTSLGFSVRREKSGGCVRRRGISRRAKKGDAFGVLIDHSSSPWAESSFKRSDLLCFCFLNLGTTILMLRNLELRLLVVERVVFGEL